MLEELKEQVYEVNLLLPKQGLVTLSWGSASGFDRESGLFVIKPSGVPYEALRPKDMVVVDLEGKRVEGFFHPSSDTPTHAVLYKQFPEIGGIVHTHSPWATSWAQAGRDIPCYGTTHAEYFYGAIPCIRSLTAPEIETDYEKNTGIVLTGEFEASGTDYRNVPAALMRNRGAYTWGQDASEAVQYAIVLEEVAKMAARSEQLNPQCRPIAQELLDKHFYRKHGEHAYYGQEKS